MGHKADRRRRGMGVLFLVLAAGMLIAGETFLNARLRQSPWLTIIYWLACFGAVILAMIVALLDFWIVRRRSRSEQRGLLQETMDKIAEEKKSREADTGIAESDRNATP
ncbi:MAG TPA: DUF3784 domain-containing protein [Verrucomicrobiae bacterium]|jgi:hypothetical protein